MSQETADCRLMIAANLSSISLFIHLEGTSCFKRSTDIFHFITPFIARLVLNMRNKGLFAPRSVSLLIKHLISLT